MCNAYAYGYSKFIYVFTSYAIMRTTTFYYVTRQYLY